MLAGPETRGVPAESSGTLPALLRPGQAEITGTVTTLTGDDVVGPPAAAPFTIMVPARGAGGAVIAGALVGGRRVAIVWNAGQPLPILGRGSLDLGPAHVELAADGVAWGLDGVGHRLTPGRYFAGAPVAVGQAGLATARENADFVADAQTVLSTSGGAVIRLPPTPPTLHLEGPGTLRLTGSLLVRVGPTSPRRVASVRFGPGPFTIDLHPPARIGSGWRLSALLQGPVASE